MKCEYLEIETAWVMGRRAARLGYGSIQSTRRRILTKSGGVIIHTLRISRDLRVGREVDIIQRALFCNEPVV